jgi:muramoyltetrapeptide carboxypeptidase LdcA involved in peptidoglycan recycling
MTSKYRKPRALIPGDTVAVISPSSGGPSAYPTYSKQDYMCYAAGGYASKNTPQRASLLRSSPVNPPCRRDVNSAFADDTVAAIWASIGGDDSVLLLPHLNKQLIAANPKILIGFSDNTTLLVYAHLLGSMVTFHGSECDGGHRPTQ